MRPGAEHFGNRNTRGGYTDCAIGALEYRNTHMTGGRAQGSRGLMLIFDSRGVELLRCAWSRGKGRAILGAARARKKK